LIESIDPATIFADAKRAADEARAVLVAEEAKLRTEDKARRAELRTKLAAIHKLLGRKAREAKTTGPKAVEAKKATA
jgi:hypothetical protein